MTDEPMFEAQGVNGAMRLWRDRLVIVKKGWPYGTKSEKTVPLRSITAVQWKDPGLTSGFLQVAYGGATESKGGVFDAAKDENTVMFVKANAAAFRSIHDTIQQLQRAGEAPETEVRHPPVASISDELEKLAGLRDRGILTDEEFQQQKRKLLG